MLKLKEKEQNLTVVIWFSKSHNRIVFFFLCDVEKLDSINVSMHLGEKILNETGMTWSRSNDRCSYVGN